MVSGSHAYARRAHVSNRSFVFLLSQVSHMRKKREKTRRRILQNGRMEHWISMSFPLVYAYSTHSFVYTHKQAHETSNTNEDAL